MILGFFFFCWYFSWFWTATLYLSVLDSLSWEMQTEGELKQHVHWGLFNTCLHFFHNRESLRLVSQSIATPNIDPAEQKFSIHFKSLSALDQLKSCGIIRCLRTQRLSLEDITRSQKGSYSNQTAQNRWDGDGETEACKCWGREWAGRWSIFRSQGSRRPWYFSGRKASNCSEEKRLNIVPLILLPPT